MISSRELTPFSPLPPIKSTKKIRPSSASANIQTHPSYTTGLFDNVLRPTTASTQGTPAHNAIGLRPHTQAGGPRSKWQSKAAESKPEEAIVKHPRRLTLGTVDGIAELDNIIRPGQIHGTVSQQLKNKVRKGIEYRSMEFRTDTIYFYVVLFRLLI